MNTEVTCAVVRVQGGSITQSASMFWLRVCTLSSALPLTFRTTYRPNSPLGPATIHCHTQRHTHTFSLERIKSSIRSLQLKNWNLYFLSEQSYVSDKRSLGIVTLFVPLSMGGVPIIPGYSLSRFVSDKSKRQFTFVLFHQAFPLYPNDSMGCWCFLCG